jgi:hypothetical protein
MGLLLEATTSAAVIWQRLRLFIGTPGSTACLPLTPLCQMEEAKWYFHVVQLQ